jgi:hypothetical protein
MENSIWKFFSYLLHPLFMATIGACMVMQQDPMIYLALDPPAIWTDLAVVFTATALFPLVLIFILRKINKISNLEDPTEEDRRMLMMFTELGFLLAFLTFRNIPPAGHSLFLFLLGINIAMVITFALNFFQRTSFHATGTGGLLGTAIGLLYYTRFDLKYWIAAAIILCYAAGYARYRLKAHNTFELYLGYIVGILSLFAVFYFGTK